MKPIKVIFECDLCNFSMTVHHDENSDSWSFDQPPDEMRECSDNDGKHIFCNGHYQKWLDKIKEQDPDGVWIG